MYFLMMHRTLIFFLGFLGSRSYWFSEFYTFQAKKHDNKNRSIQVRFNLKRKISVLIHVQKECIGCGSIFSLVQIFFSSFSNLLSYFTIPKNNRKTKFKSTSNLNHDIYSVSQTKIAPILFRRTLWTSERMKQISAPSGFQYALQY